MHLKVLALSLLLCLTLCGCTDFGYTQSPIDAGMEELDKYAKQVQDGLEDLAKFAEENAPGSD